MPRRTLRSLSRRQIKGHADEQKVKNKEQWATCCPSLGGRETLRGYHQFITEPLRTDVRGRSSDRHALYSLGPDSHLGGTCDAGPDSNVSWYKLETILHQETVKPWISHLYGSFRRLGLQLLTVKPCLGSITTSDESLGEHEVCSIAACSSSYCCWWWKLDGKGGKEVWRVLKLEEAAQEWPLGAKFTA
jgi:hypothetical protein